ncbi:IS630 family transposase [Methylobacterium sp. J-043]|nr:IS630 family transposase [Methylobacterium sp. J-043]
MGSPLSLDLRERVVKAVSEGASRRQAAERFGVSPASAIRWQESFEREGRVAAKPQGGDRRSQHVEAHADLILRLRAEQPTLILSELRALLAERGIATSESGLSRFFRRHPVTPQKNTPHAAEQQRPDVRAEREDWFEAQDELDPERLVFLDETATTTNMVRRYGWAARGERCRVAVPHGHWRTTTVTAALRTSGVVATALFDGATNGERFRAYVTATLVPLLKRGDTVIMDNLAAHKVAGVREAIQAVGAKLLYLPPYSLDLNPIEQIFAKLKGNLRKAAARTLPDLKAAIRSAFDTLTPRACRNCLAAAGYDAYDPI